MLDHFIYLIIISAFAYTPGTHADTFANFVPADRPKDENLINEATLQEEVCNARRPCQNGGTCSGGACECPQDYTGSLCETPAYCTPGRCGYGSDVECVWDSLKQRGECRCKRANHYYLRTKRRCEACQCGDHGRCEVVDEALLTCKCDEKYALRTSTCEPCDCGPGSERCFFSSRGAQACLCRKGYAPKIADWSKHEIKCEKCECGVGGRCRWDGDVKRCDCEAGYRAFGGRCKECMCGKYGTCTLDESGDKVCLCDYGYAEKDGYCHMCDCNYLTSQRIFGVNCTFVDGQKHCICPPGFEAGSEDCKDINECYSTTTAPQPCPRNSLCINKPGTFECKCEPGYKPMRSSSDSTPLLGCEDIDECSESPCTSPATRCVNSPGSYDCVCREGYYATSGTYGGSYKPAYNACYETETQWREATIALGVILAVGIIGISCYIMKHKSST